jgi:phosphatidylglycerol:prolipoprotein diacylglycerol transferase
MNLLNAITWNVNPALLEFENFEIRYYGVLFAAGFLISYYMVQHFYKRESQNPEEVDKLTLYVLLGAVLGARFGHVFFYEPQYYLAHPSEILKVWHGGLASHGGTIGILLALILYVKKFKRNYLWTLDRIAIPTALTGAMIRLGNLMNSEIYGHETDLPWGFIFERNNEVVAKHPTQIYEALSYLLIFVLLWFMYKKRGKETPHGLIVGIFLVAVFGMRFLIEFIKNDQVAFESGMLINMGQWLSIPMVLGGAFLWFRASKNK